MRRAVSMGAFVGSPLETISSSATSDRGAGSSAIADAIISVGVPIISESPIGEDVRPLSVATASFAVLYHRQMNVWRRA